MSGQFINHWRVPIEILLAQADVMDEADANTTYYGYYLHDYGYQSKEMAILKVEISGNITTYKWSYGSRQIVANWNQRTSITYDYKRS